MVARTIPQLLGDMPAGVPGGTNIGDMHNLVHTMEARTTFSVKQFGADGTQDSQSTAEGDTAAFIAATAAAAATANGAGAVYIPAGVYHINPNQWAIPSKVKVFGDGYGTKVRKNGDGWLLDISGTGNWAAGTQVRNSYCIIRDIAFDGRDNDDCLLRIIYGSEVLIDKCRFSFNAGPAIDATEWWDSRVNNCFFDWCGDLNNPSIRMRNSSNATVDALGYSEDSTNAIYLYGCRFESFKNGALWLDRGPVADLSSLSQIFMTNCKMETHYLAGSLIKFDSLAAVSNIHIDTLFISVNAFAAGYTPPASGVDLIDWNVNNSCSIRNVWVWNANSTLVRTVVKANLSFNTCTLENIFVAGTKPNVGVVETNSTSEPKMLGYIGGTTNSMEATVNAKGTGLTRALTAARPATQLDNGIMYTNNTGGDLVVTLSQYTSPGWKCQALQLSAAGTITFQPVSGSGTTFIHENGANHRRTGGQYATVDVRCVSNNSTMTAAVFHVRGKTAPVV